jgi:archaemetzincin
MVCGNVPAFLIANAQAAIEGTFGLRLFGPPEAIDPAAAYDAKRNQYDSTLLLRQIIASRPRGAFRVLGLTDLDLFIPMLSFVFGQAQVGGPGAIVSSARLAQEFYGLPAEPEILAGRFRKEILHELGHTLSLVHCPDSSCIMSLAIGIRQVDSKSGKFCSSCRVLVDEYLEGVRGTTLENRK